LDKTIRKFKEWGWYSDINVSRLFLHLLLSVNYEDKPWKKIIIKKGSLITSREHLANETGLTVQQVRSCLSSLKSTNEITIKTTNKYTEITINKFNDYQQITNNLTNEQPTNNQQITTTKEYKNIRNKEIDIMSEQFLLKWNEVFGTKYTSTVPINKPLTEWLKIHSIDDICKAIENIKFDSYWKDKDVNPLWLLRFKDNNGNVDRIETLLNVKKIQENIRL
jgi:hypothetical protein